MVTTHRRSVMTRGQGDAHDVTDVVSHIVADSRIASGTATVFIVGSTAAVTTIEFEPGAIADLNRLFEQIAPRDADYRHHLRWGDDNASSPAASASAAAMFFRRKIRRCVQSVVTPGAGVTVRTSSNTAARRASSSIGSATVLMYALYASS